MQDKSQLTLLNSIVRITGVFEYGNLRNAESLFAKSGFILEQESNQQFHKNYWYPEFREIFFKKTANVASARILTKEIKQEIVFLKKNFSSNEIVLRFPVVVDSVEIFLFKNGLHFFNVSFNTEGYTLNQVSDLTNFARSFDSLIENESNSVWVNWVENEILNGIKIYSKWNEEPVAVDEYSGSKFKLYTVIDLAPNSEINEDVIDELLYDIGCVAPLNSANGNTPYSPSKAYFKELLTDKITAFNNFAMLPLFDSFTTVGYNLLNLEYQKNTFKSTYFRIYLFNLVVKYNLYRYNHDLRLDSIKTREKFETFLNQYNFSVISYNFLPNIIFTKHRKSMRIEEELAKFELRINKISQSIQEEQQKRMNLLLGIVTIVTSLNSVDPALKIISDFRKILGWSEIVYYACITIVAIVILPIIAAYLFPEKKRQFVRRFFTSKKTMH